MKNSNYKNYLSAHPFYSQENINTQGSFRFFEKNYLRFLPHKNSANILDIGCGTGDFLSFLKKKNFTNFLGIDVSKEQIEHCKKYVTKRVILISDLKEFLKDKKNSFDFILMNDVIEHLEKDQILDILSLIKNSLKQKGVVIIRTVNLKNRWGIAVRYMDFTHTVGFTEESLKQVMLTSGFKYPMLVEEIHPIHDIKSFLRISAKRIFDFFYRLEYIASFGAFNPMLSNMLICVGKKE